MISAQEFMTGVVMGAILIVLGLVPGLLEKWADGLSNFAELLLYRMPIGYRSPRQVTQHRWLAALGAAFIALTLYLYSAR